jgi:NAD(P)-dependent dehydrogenase (short-subunit alcohol dehydrogenase family)
MSLQAESQPAGRTAAPDLEGKVAVVTGAARGIGRAIAEALAAQGSTVVVSDLAQDAASTAAAEIDGADALACDVSDEDQVAELFAGAVSRHGRVDIAVANAGISGLGPLAELSFQDWRKMMAVNLDGVFLTVKHAARAMVGAGDGGSIITMASVTGLAGVPLVGHYAAAKAGVISLTKTAALELRSASVRVNAICPGFADTELVSAQKGGYEQALGLSSFDALIHQAQGGYVTLDDIARLTVFLASERSRFCTGGAFVVDGGLTASLL